MQILVEVGEKIKTFTYPDDTTFEQNVPMHGWLRIIANGQTSWFNMTYVIAVVPDKVLSYDSRRR